ncbi:MAG: hypothetical protein ABW199_03060 [Caulobacterales bacterium]
MKYVCGAPGAKTWFQIETEAEAQAESEAMSHAVQRYFERAKERAAATYNPAGISFIERDIGLKGHIERTMPMFLTLRADDGEALATAMLPPGGKADPAFKSLIVGPRNSDPYPQHNTAIEALANHFSILLPRDACFPYG